MVVEVEREEDVRISATATREPKLRSDHAGRVRWEKDETGNDGKAKYEIRQPAWSNILIVPPMRALALGEIGRKSTSDSRGPRRSRG